jgi:hypothetical protein
MMENMTDIDKLAPMRVDVLKKLQIAINLNLADLRAAKFGRLSIIAWLARNILELATWSAHCARSEKNSKGFVLDAGRDVNDALNVPDGIFSQTFSFRGARQENLDRAIRDGLTSLDDKYNTVYDVAKQLGQGDMFRYTNKLFSKFAHPTALSVIYGDRGTLKTMRDKFYNIGVDMAEASLQEIDKVLQRIAPDGGTAV